MNKTLYRNTLVSALGFISLLLINQSAHAQAMGAMGAPAAPEPLEMGFFVTSVGLGNGADLGGLEGADAHCQALAEEVGAGGRTWRAFLSTQATGGAAAVNAIDRIGEGPWGNAKGVPIATDKNSLIYDNSNFTYENALNEKGGTVNSRAMGDDPNMHDVLTGTDINGMAFDASEDMTCSNFTSSSSEEGKAAVGHSDRHRGTTPGSHWGMAHASRGCSQDQLAASGGAGLYYCFAAD